MDDVMDDRWVPSPNDIMLNYQEAVNNEDRVRIASWGAQNRPVDPAVEYGMKAGTLPPASRAELLSFAKGSDWKAALDDPASRAAIRRVRDRISSLKEEGMAVVTNKTVQPNVGCRLLNERVREPVKHEFFMSSTLNPLEASHPTRGWDPRVRPWPGRRINDRASAKEETSYWVMSWVPSNKALDTDFHCVRPQDITPEARATKLALHSKAFR